mgnify:CR=1 FL=1
MAIGAERGHIQRNEQVGMLGIGSGINSLMLAVHWQTARVLGELDTPARTPHSRHRPVPINTL